MEGFHGAVRAVVDQVSRGDHPTKAVNLMPGFVFSADIRHLKEIFEDFGVDPIILPDISEVLDGPALEDYETIPRGGTPLSDIEAMGGSKATIVYCL